MRTFITLATAALAAGAVGCTHQSLTRHTVLTTTTVTEIKYTEVLNNLAMFSIHPETLPNHVHLADGVVQINDRAGFGQSGGFTTFGGTTFGIDQFGPDGQRQVTEQWGTDATTDPERLTDLQDLYRVALGLSPLPLPNAIAYLRQRTAQGEKGGDDGGKKKSDSGSSGKDGGRTSGRDIGPDGLALMAGLGQSGTTSSGGGGSTPSSGSGSSDSDGGRNVPIEVLLTDVPPPGWYHLGCKKDVPKDACYVGRYGDRYAWVTSDGIPQLARLTVTVLNVIKLKPGQGGGGKHGLAVTGGR